MCTYHDWSKSIRSISVVRLKLTSKKHFLPQGIQASMRRSAGTPSAGHDGPGVLPPRLTPSQIRCVGITRASYAPFRESFFYDPRANTALKRAGGHRTDRFTRVTQDACGRLRAPVSTLVCPRRRCSWHRLPQRVPQCRPTLQLQPKLAGI